MHCSSNTPTRVMALHALKYCERLFYLEEVEEIRVADGRVYAGRRLHEEVADEDTTNERRSIELESEEWGIFGKADAVRRRDGRWIAYEHKRGRSNQAEDGSPLAWESDRIQAIAYAVLLEEHLREAVPEARVRYHANNKTARVTIDEQARQDLRAAILRAQTLRNGNLRPPVTDDECKCPNCSLAPVCLPEEERLALSSNEASPPPRIFPQHRDRQTIHVTTPKSRIGRSGMSLTVNSEHKAEKIGIEQIDCVLIHGYAQISTQAIQLCSSRDVPIFWLTSGGRFLTATCNAGRVKQRIRQYESLTDLSMRLRLAKRLIHAKIETQLKFILRATRGAAEKRDACQTAIRNIRSALAAVGNVESNESLLGYEGQAAKAYFSALPQILGKRVDNRLKPTGRSRRPPKDAFNAALSYGYSLVQALVLRSVLAVGLEPAFGFYHQPRSAASPLVLDLMELFRTPLWEMPLIGSLNRGAWNLESDFDTAHDHVWLSPEGRKKAIEIFEARIKESYKHPFNGHSMEYARIVELEVRLLEKEWSGITGVFAQMRLR
ncbi:MAG: type I-MYXAN CRISPR-associated endonuclease Cas1 [bacterium]|nr:type I-MYXAN CRISPR-associated endonuclease Cas1 [bacterium]